MQFTSKCKTYTITVESNVIPLNDRELKGVRIVVYKGENIVVSHFVHSETLYDLATRKGTTKQMRKEIRDYLKPYNITI